MGAPAGIADKLADWLIVPGFSSLGYKLRGLDRSTEDAGGNLRGKSVLITGASSGIGAAATERFAALGAHVHMVVRDTDKGEEVKVRISERTGSDAIEVHRCDVSSLASVRALVRELDKRLDGLDVLVHNAGIMAKERTESADGIELTLATHVVGPLLLTELLRPQLAERVPSRVIFVTSGGMYGAKVRPDDLELSRSEFNGTSFYAHAKRVQVIITSMLDRELAPSGTRVNAMHPGWADTPGVVDSLPGFHRLMGPILRSPEEGADTIVWLAASPEGGSRGGELWMDRAPRGEHRLPWTRETETDRARTWTRVRELARIPEPAKGATPAAAR